MEEAFGDLRDLISLENHIFQNGFADRIISWSAFRSLSGYKYPLSYTKGGLLRLP